MCRLFDILGLQWPTVGTVKGIKHTPILRRLQARCCVYLPFLCCFPMRPNSRGYRRLHNNPEDFTGVGRYGSTVEEETEAGSDHTCISNCQSRLQATVARERNLTSIAWRLRIIGDELDREFVHMYAPNMETNSVYGYIGSLLDLFCARVQQVQSDRQVQPLGGGQVQVYNYAVLPVHSMIVQESVHLLVRGFREDGVVMMVHMFLIVVFATRGQHQ